MFNRHPHWQSPRQSHVEPAVLAETGRMISDLFRSGRLTRHDAQIELSSAGFFNAEIAEILSIYRV